MARLLLDTTFLVDAERGGVNLIGEEDDVAIAAVSIAELEVGVQLATGRRREARRRFVDGIGSGIPVIEYDTAVALVHGELLASVRRAGKPRGAHDLIIAATARASDRSIITSDRSAFADLPGVSVLGN